MSLAKENRAQDDRFDASRIAFHSLSRRLGRSWIEAYMERAAERARTDPEARKALAELAGARTLNFLVGPYGEGRENRGLLAWAVAEDRRSKLGRLPWPCEVPEENTAWVCGLARRLGALDAGVAALDRRWVYGRVQTNPYAPGEPVTKPIAFRPVPEPGETEAEFVLPEGVRRAVVLLAPMDRRRLGKGRPYDASIETNLGYSRMAELAVSVAEAIRAAGFVAVPCMNDTALSVPLAVAAGLGRAGRHGLLAARGWGSAVRIAKVLTDMPLAPGEPPEDPLADLCHDCGICAKACPAGAIPQGPPTREAPHPCNRAGDLKWPVNGEACLSYWVERGESCALCQAVCPLQVSGVGGQRTG